MMVIWRNADEPVGPRTANGTGNNVGGAADAPLAAPLVTRCVTWAGSHPRLTRHVARRTALAATVAAAALAWPSSVPAAHAQGTVSQPASSSSPQARSFNIPGQGLGTAISVFGRQSGLQVTADASLVAGRSSSPVSGPMTPEAALARLLAGTGLTYRFLNATTVTLEAPAPASSSSMELPPVQVEGQQETAWTSGRGYLATRSAAGTKTDTPLIETPQAITVIDRAQMNAQGVQTVNQALRYAPGVKTDVTGSDLRFDGDVYIRGFEADQYLDGLKLFGGAFSAPVADPWMLERIDVVHGPGSVLYGQASPGGFVNMTSKMPTDMPLHVVQMSTGSFGLAEGAFDLGGPLNDDHTLSYRLTGIGRSSGSQVNDTTYQRFAIAPAFTWRPDNDTSFTLLTSFLDDPYAGYYNQLPLQGTVLYNPNGRIPTYFNQGNPDFDRFRRSQASVGYILEHRFNDVWTVRQNVRYLYQQVDYNGTYGIGFEPNLSTINRDVFNNREFTNTVALDNNAQADFTTGPLRHTVLLGLGYQYFTTNQTYLESATSSIDFLNPVYLPASLAADAYVFARFQKQSNVGIYAQDQIRLGGWSLTLGARQDWLSTDTTDKVSLTQTNRQDSHPSWRTALMYNFDIGVAPYFSYATSFQPTSGTNYAGDAFKPTIGEQFEIGVKYKPPGVNALFTVAAYNLTQQNVLTTDPVNPNFSVQTGEIRSRGIELSATGSLDNGLSFVGAVAIQNVERTSDNSGLQGKSLNGLPKAMGSAWVDYAFQAPPLEGLSLGGGLRLMSWQYGDTTNSFKAPGYALVDMAIRYQLDNAFPALKGASVQLNATNLFDTRYIVTSQNYGAYYGLRRTILATVSYRW